MKFELIIRPEAESEIGEAFDWYENRLPNLGAAFLLSLEAAFNAILRNPQQFQLVYQHIRRALIKRFPYQVLYIIDDDKIIVLAMFHAKRNPKHWIKRAT